MNAFSKGKKYIIDPRKATTVQDCTLLFQILFRYLTQTPVSNRDMGYSIIFEDEESYEKMKHLIKEND